MHFKNAQWWSCCDRNGDRPARELNRTASHVRVKYSWKAIVHLTRGDETVGLSHQLVDSVSLTEPSSSSSSATSAAAPLLHLHCPAMSTAGLQEAPKVCCAAPLGSGHEEHPLGWIRNSKTIFESKTHVGRVHQLTYSLTCGKNGSARCEAAGRSQEEESSTAPDMSKMVEDTTS